MFFILILFEESSSNCGFGYADDTSVVKVGKNPLKVVEAAQEEVDKTTQLGLTHKLQFDTSKPELLIIGADLRRNWTHRTSQYESGNSLLHLLRKYDGLVSG